MQRRELACVSDGTRLAGTLSLPDGDGPWPAIVTLHGSSSGSRDHRLFLHLEALLVPAGFAVHALRPARQWRLRGRFRDR